MPEWISGSSVTGVTAAIDRSLTFSEDNIQVWGSGVRRLVVALSGDATTTIANIRRITLKVKSQLRIDAPPIHIAAWLSAFTKKEEWASTATRFTIPLDMFMGLGADPSGKLRLEIEKAAAMLTPTAALHEYVDDETPVTAFGNFLSTSQSLVGASANTQPVSIQGEGTLLGITVPDVANVTLLRVKNKGRLVTEFTSSQAIIEANQLGRGGTVVTTVYVPIPPFEIGPSTLIQVSTGAGYTAGEWGIHTVQQYA